jgi:hypothetical protein
LRKPPSLAPASSRVSESVVLLGAIPRRRMSSLNEVIVSCCEILGCWT